MYTIRKRPATEALVKERLLGKNYEEIAKKFKISTSTVCVALKEHTKKEYANCKCKTCTLHRNKLKNGLAFHPN